MYLQKIPPESSIMLLIWFSHVEDKTESFQFFLILVTEYVKVNGLMFELSQNNSSHYLAKPILKSHE